MSKRHGRRSFTIVQREIPGTSGEEQTSAKNRQLHLAYSKPIQSCHHFSIVLGGTTIHNSMTFLTDVAQLGACGQEA